MNIYTKDTTDFDNNGLGFLTDVLEAYIIEELNGDYYLSFEYPLNGKLSEFLTNENIIKCKVSDGSKQLFVIKDKRKNFKTITVVAKHIFYLLNDNFLEDVYPQNLLCNAFLNWILEHTQYPHRFIGYSNINNIRTARYVQKNPVESILGEDDNSMVNIFGGEIKRDNFVINFLEHVGNDNGLTLHLGKNVTGIDIETDSSETYTRIMPIGFDGLMLPEKYIDSPNIKNYPYPKIKKIKFENIKFDVSGENAYHTLDDAYNALRNEVQNLYTTGIDKPKVNVKIDWIELSKTKEYEKYISIERVNIGDTIHAKILNENFETRVIKTKYNPLNDMIEEYEIGNTKSTIGNYITSISKKIEEFSFDSVLLEAQANATKLITQAMGGYVYKTQNEIYIMDTNDPNTAQRVWRWNINGLGYSSTGINGSYGLALTMDGQIVADFITTGILRAIGSYFTDVHVNGGDIILNDDGTSENASIRIKTISHYNDDISINDDLSDQLIFSNFEGLTYEYITTNFSNFPIELISSENYKIVLNVVEARDGNLAGFWLTDSDGVILGALQAVYEDSNLETDGNYELPTDFGNVTYINPLSIVQRIQKYNAITRETTYSGYGMQANIISDFNYTTNDVEYMAQKMIEGGFTQEDIIKYDTNKDGIINVVDLSNIRRYVLSNITPSNPGRFIIDTHAIRKNIKFIDGEGNEKLTFGLDGIYMDGNSLDDLYGSNNILWQANNEPGGYYMTAEHTAKLSEKVSEQAHGIILVWWGFNPSTQSLIGGPVAQQVIPKYLISDDAMTFHQDMHYANFTYSGTKVVYITDSSISGNDGNTATGTGGSGIKYNNNRFVLSYVIGF